MVAALILLLVLTSSVVVVRAGAVALWLTGMPEQAARFQARAAFTGTGFTTSESETIGNRLVVRRIICMIFLYGTDEAVSAL